MKITKIQILAHQRNTKFLNNLPSYWSKYVTLVKNSQDISNVSYVNLYTHLKSYEQHAMKTLSKMNQSSGNTDPLAYMAQATKTSSHTSSQQYSPLQYVPPQPHYTPPPQQSPQSTNDVMLATMNQIFNLLSVFQKQFPPTNNQLRTFTNPMTQATIQAGQITTESVQRRAPGNKGVALDAKAEAFLADVECTAHYDDSLAITTTTRFEVSHEDAYDSDVDEAPHVAVAFMANLTGTSTEEGTSNDIDFYSEVHTHNNHFFENVNHQVTQAMNQEEQLDSDVDSDIDDYDNIIPYHQYQSNTKVENVPTEVGSNSSVSSGATIPLKPKAAASGLYVMTPKYVPPQKRINRETNSSLPKKETVTIVNLSNVHVNLPTGIKYVLDASKSKSKSDKMIHKNLPARSKNVKRVTKPSRNLNKKNRVDSSLNGKRIGFISKSIFVCKTCNECLVFGNHDECVVKSVNAKKPKVINNANVKQVWKAIDKLFASVGSRWKPTGRKFTLGDTCPLTRIIKPEVVFLENSGSVRTSKPTNNVTVTPRFSKKTLTSYKRKDRNTKDTSTGSPSNIETMAAKYPVIGYHLHV
nr:hypothetical protein [Tanacetum cinerariifolium]